MTKHIVWYVGWQIRECCRSEEHRGCSCTCHLCCWRRGCCQDKLLVVWTSGMPGWHWCCGYWIVWGVFLLVGNTLLVYNSAPFAAQKDVCWLWFRFCWLFLILGWGIVWQWLEAFRGPGGCGLVRLCMGGLSWGENASSVWDIIFARNDFRTNFCWKVLNFNYFYITYM